MDDNQSFAGWPVSVDLLDTVEIEFDLEPYASPRPRSVPYLVRVGMVLKARVHVFNNTEYTKWKEAFALSYREAGGPQFNKGEALALRVFCRHKISESRARQKKFREGIFPRTIRPDFDNLLKSPCDALEGIAYANDSQIAYCEFLKIESAQYEPAILFRLSRLSLTVGGGQSNLLETSLGKGAHDGIGGSERLEGAPS